MNTLPEYARQHGSSLALAAMFVLCAFAYVGGLGGGFLFDDFQNIANNRMLRAIGTPAQSWLALTLSSDAGLLRRPVSMLTFGLNVLMFGMNPLAFKLVNVGIHLANGALVYALGRRVAGRLSVARMPASIRPEILALVATGLWLAHPLNVSGVVYVVQRMNELAAFFTLAGLLAYVDGRVRMLRGEPALGHALLGLCAFGLLAVFSKENGALICAYALVIETICFGFEAKQSSQRLIIQGFFWLTVALPLGLFAAFLISHPQWLSISYGIRSFTLYQRMLSESRILCDYLLWIFVPLPSWMSIYHDDIVTSTSLFSPFATAPAIVFLLALAIVAWKFCHRSPGFAFGVSWFIVGHAMESTILPLELVFEHRNYLPMAGLLLGIVCAVSPWLTLHSSARVAAVAAMTLVVALGGLTAARAARWGDPFELALTDARNHPNSSRSQYEAGRSIVIAGAMKGERAKADIEAEPYYARAAALDKKQIAPAAELMLIQASRGRVSRSSLDDLSVRLRDATSYTQANAFLDMLTTASMKELSLTPADFSALVEVALANPHFPPKVRAMVMNNFGAYQFNILHDEQGAITWTLAAAREEPRNPYFPLNLAKLALAVKQPDKAREYLDMARQLNQVGAYDREIDDLQHQVPQ